MLEWELIHANKSCIANWAPEENAQHILKCISLQNNLNQLENNVNNNDPVHAQITI